MSISTVKNLEALRSAMRKHNVDAVIIPGTDPHQSEYVSDHWKFRDWISGFTGSNGTAVVTLGKAALWTDSRYFLQAKSQLDGSGFELVKEKIPGEPTIQQWLAQNLSDDSLVAIDGRLFSIIEANRLENFCGENGFMLATNFYPADEIWTDRPGIPAGKAYVHDVAYAGEDVDSKVSRTIDAVQQLGATSTFIASLDEIAWLFNLRGSDVDYTPVVISYAYISADERVIFIDGDKLTPEVKEHFKAHGIKVKDYDDVEHFLEKRRESDTVLLDPNRVSDTLGQAIMCGKIYAQSPVIDLKSVKNDVQIEGFRKAMELDGAALVRLFRWLEAEVPNGGINEVDVSNKGIELRSQSDLYRGDSFAMIAGYKEHGAIVHYQADDSSASTLHPDGLLLVDTGGQYLCGTTDITRTISLGNPTPDEIHDFTLVLKGHLALARAKFPVGTTGVQLDILAHEPLWAEGKTFRHGTGHGVGHFLGCHEGPQSIRTDINPAVIKPGMVTSDEPGLYITGKYGIRTEVLLLCVEGQKTDDFGDFLEFEVLTLFPYDTSLIDIRMLSQAEIDQLNTYHKLVFDRLSPYLNDDEKAWLAQKTQPVHK